MEHSFTRSHFVCVQCKMITLQFDGNNPDVCLNGHPLIEVPIGPASERFLDVIERAEGHSYIKQFRADDGSYVDAEEVHYDNAEAFLISIAGFCYCGRPDEVLQYLRDGLNLVKELCEISWKDYRPGSPTPAFDSWNHRCDKLFGAMHSRDFFWYYCDHQEFIEHGSAIPGWLTDKGKGMLADLERLYGKTTQHAD